MLVTHGTSNGFAGLVILVPEVVSVTWRACVGAPLALLGTWVNCAA